MHPFALARPGDIARRNLRQRHKRHAGITHVGQAQGVPGGFGGGRPAFQFRLMFSAMAVAMDSIISPVLGAPTGMGVSSTGGMATHTPAANTLAYFGLRW